MCKCGIHTLFHLDTYDIHIWHTWSALVWISGDEVIGSTGITFELFQCNLVLTQQQQSHKRKCTFTVIFCINVLLQDLLQVLCFLMQLYPKILKQYCCSLLLQGVFPLPPNNIAMISKQIFLPSLKVLTSNCLLHYWSLWSCDKSECFDPVACSEMRSILLTIKI